jgi:hypothetical protein
VTNTLHRRGTAAELEHDYVVKSFSTGNREGAAEKMSVFKGIALKHHPVAARLPNGSIRDVNEFVFDNPEAVKAVLTDLKAAELGVSVVVSGLIGRVQECCREAGLSLHTVEHSLGILGRRERLPTSEIVDISSLCGHSMVSYNLIDKMISLVKLGRLTPQAAATYLTKPCTCGSFNPKRVEAILEQLKVRS